jgi:hypothetical protein
MTPVLLLVQVGSAEGWQPRTFSSSRTKYVDQMTRMART